MKPVFADTFFFLAVLNRDDPWHAKAVRAHRVLRPRWITTAWVLTEVADALAAPSFRPRFAEFHASLTANPNVRLIPATQELFERGIRLFKDRPDKAWSLTDCISFVAMQEEGVTEALTGDRHFEQAGFKALLL